jgi:hypothetical protein
VVQAFVAMVHGREHHHRYAGQLRCRDGGDLFLPTGVSQTLI